MLFGETIFRHYAHVRIKDSTRFNLPAKLATNYRGSGGSEKTSRAGVSIQYEFDLKTNEILDLTIHPAVRNDQTDARERAGDISGNDLVIRDLEYFSTEVLGKIADKKAFFLSRLQSSVNVYDRNNKETDFRQLHAFMTKNGIENLEKQVFIGKNRLPVRLIIGLVPPPSLSTKNRS